MKSTSYSFLAAPIVLVCFFLFSSCKEKEQVTMDSTPEIDVVNVIQMDIPIYREYVGEVSGFLDIPIRARVDGFLTGVYFDEGFQVEKGQLLYTIDPQPYEAEVASFQSKVAEAQTYLVNATNELARYKPLAEINAVSKSDLDAAQASRDAAEASLQAAQANLKQAQIRLGYTKLSSPIDGLIGKTEARTGEYVGKEPNPVILNVVSDIERTRVQFNLTEAEYLQLARRFEYAAGDDPHTDPDDKYNLELILADGTLYDQKGSAEFIGREVDASTGSILVQAIFPNPQGFLRPGMYAKVKVRFRTAKGALLVPQRCVTELQGQYSVYVIEEGNVVKARQVNATERYGDLWLITEGLNPDDRIVIDGLQKVAAGMEIEPKLTQFQSKFPELQM